jgi:hypothetical protein
MNKIVVSVALVLGLGISQARAQEAQSNGVLGGIKVDANMSNFILDDMDGMKSKVGFGASVGGSVKIALGEYLALQPELLLHFKNSVTEVRLTGKETDFQYFGVEIPLYAVGQMNLGNGKGFIGFGPYWGLGIDARYKTSGTDDVNVYKEYGGQKSEMQRWDLGAGGILGYEFGCRLQITASYKMGLINTLNANKDNASMFNQTITVGIAYRFGK